MARQSLLAACATLASEITILTAPATSAAMACQPRGRAWIPTAARTRSQPPAISAPAIAAASDAIENTRRIPGAAPGAAA